jgi:hypothetical protein
LTYAKVAIAHPALHCFCCFTDMKKHKARDKEEGRGGDEGGGGVRGMGMGVLSKYSARSEPVCGGVALLLSPMEAAEGGEELRRSKKAKKRKRQNKVSKKTRHATHTHHLVTLRQGTAQVCSPHVVDY